MVRLVGLEPTRLAAKEPKSFVYTNFTTGARLNHFWSFSLCEKKTLVFCAKDCASGNVPPETSF